MGFGPLTARSRTRRRGPGRIDGLRTREAVLVGLEPRADLGGGDEAGPLDVVADLVPDDRPALADGLGADPDVGVQVGECPLGVEGPVLARLDLDRAARAGRGPGRL